MGKYHDRMGPIALGVNRSLRRTTLNTKPEESCLGTLWHPVCISFPSSASLKSMVGSIQVFNTIIKSYAWIVLVLKKELLYPYMKGRSRFYIYISAYGNYLVYSSFIFRTDSVYSWYRFDYVLVILFWNLGPYCYYGAR